MVAPEGTTTHFGSDGCGGGGAGGGGGGAGQGFPVV